MSGVAALVALLALGSTAGRAGSAGASSCAPLTATAGYTSSVQQAVAAGPDLWGARLLHARGGPTYAAARRLLTPLTQAMQWQGRPLTASGSYYMPLSFPFTSYGSTVFALHVADGSEIITRRIGGPSLAVYVGDGQRALRLVPRLACSRPSSRDGYLPIAADVVHRRRRASATGRSRSSAAPTATYGARSVISFVRLDRRRALASRGRDRPPRAVAAARAHGARPPGPRRPDAADRQ